MTRYEALYHYMNRVHERFSTPYEQFLDDPRNWVRSDRSLTPSELEYAQRAFDELSDMQTRSHAQAGISAVRADEEVGVGESNLSMPFQP